MPVKPLSSQYDNTSWNNPTDPLAPKYINHAFDVAPVATLDLSKQGARIPINAAAPLQPARNAMQLPFTKSAPFPTAAFTPTPARLQMGVESQARAAQPPVNPALNTTASDRMAALGRSSAPVIGPIPAPAPLTPSPAGMGQMMSAPSQRAASPLGGMASSSPLGGMSSRSPLGGMPTSSISSRGGPMSYSPQGVGTTNPNAYAVGRNNKNFAERTRQSPMPMMAPLMPGRQAAPASMMLGGAPGQSSAPVMPGRDDAFWASMDNTAFIAEQDALRAADAGAEVKAAEDQANRERSMEVTTTAIPGTDYVIPFAGNKAMRPLPFMKADAPLPAGLVPTGAVRGGVQYGPAETAQTGKAPAFTYEKDPTGKITGAVYPVQDPQTGAWRLQRADINGDGVISPAEAAAAGGAAPAAASAGAAVKTKAGNSYTFK